MGNCEQSLPKNIQYHRSLGIVTTVTKDNKRYTKMSIPIIDNQIYSQWQKQLVKVTCNKILQDFLYLPLYKEYLRSNLFCNSTDLAQLCFQYSKRNLEEEWECRVNKNQRFLENQLWNIAYVIAKVGRYFENIGSNIGTISLSNILYNQKDQLKLVCLHSWPNIKDNSIKFQQQKDLNLFLALQQLETFFVKSNTAITQINHSNSQSFTVGMILLQCATLKRCSILYIERDGKYQIDQRKLKQYFKNVQEYYSTKFLQTLKGLLELSPIKRKNLSHLSTILQKFQQNFLSSGKKCQPIHIITQQSLNNQNIPKKLLFNTSGMLNNSIENDKRQNCNKLKQLYSYPILF